jgi:hypothetical protein
MTTTAADQNLLATLTESLRRRISGWEKVQPNRALVTQAWAVAPDYGSTGPSFAYCLGYNEDRTALVPTREAEEGGYFHGMTLWARADAAKIARKAEQQGFGKFKIVHEVDIRDLVLADTRPILRELEARVQ